MTKNKFTFRKMQAADLSAVLLIEQEHAFPWTPGMLQDCLTAHYACRVLENDQHIIGFSILTMGVEQAELLNIAIKREYQQQGLGQTLLAHMITLAKQAQAQEILLEVRASNTAALALYKKMGFQQIGIREKYYPAQPGREDALVLVLFF